MAATCLDDFVEKVHSADTHTRVQVHVDLVKYLQDSEQPMHSEELDRLVDGLVAWINCSNYKISIGGLEVISLLVERLNEKFRPFVSAVIPAAIDRLGAAKDQVREVSQDTLLRLMDCVTPQYVFDRTGGAFTHKLWRVREQILVILQKTLKQHGAKSLSLSNIVSAICRLLDDQSIPVRDAAVDTLVEIYRNVGERVRVDLKKKEIHPTRLSQVFKKMDELHASGDMLAEAREADFVKPVGVPKTKRLGSGSSSQSRTSKKSTDGTKSASSTGGGGAAGAVDVESFTQAFEDVPKVHLFSARDLADHIGRTRDLLGDTNADWEKRVDALKGIRGLLIAGAADYDEFTTLLRTLEPGLVMSIRDLRSQVVREACITVVYLSQRLGNRFDRCAESVLPPLVNLIQNGAKIMATSGSVSIRLIMQYTHSPRLIPLLTCNLSSKSSIIRRDCLEVLDWMLGHWPTHTLERHIATLQDAVKRGISDPDAAARAHARHAYWGFANHFSEQANSLLNSLDSSKQKLLQGEHMSASSPSNGHHGAAPKRVLSSLPSASSKPKNRPRSMSNDRANTGFYVYNRPQTTSSNNPKRSALTRDNNGSVSNLGTTDAAASRNGAQMTRSSSARDLAFMNPGDTGSLGVGKLRPVATAAGRVPTNSNYSSLPRPQKHLTTATSPTVYSPERSRQRSRIGVSQSQPSSRSNSPSSHLSYLTHTKTQPTPGRVRRKSGIPCSQGASRESSPSRTYGRKRNLSGGGLHQVATAGRTQVQPRGVILAQRVLTQGSDVEAAVADALSASSQNRHDSTDLDDAASETSSVCSERSFGAYSRTSEDMAEVITNLGSSSWADRREGLVGLQNQLQAQRTLSRAELKKITDIFTRMFHDPHGKVFSIFLETLITLLGLHAADLNDWLPVCLTRLVSKMGADIFGSMQAKVQRALDTVRESFAYSYQFGILIRFMVDPAQKLSMKQTKVKLALLNYLHGLAALMEPAELVNTSEVRLAVSRVTAWTTEPKSVDVRKAAQTVLINLFNLNPPELMAILAGLPNTFQEGAATILNNHVRRQETEPLTPRNVTSPIAGSQYRNSPARAMDDVDTENMNPEEIYNSIKKTSADIQNLSLGAGSDDVTTARGDTASQDSGIQDVNRPTSPMARGASHSIDTSTSKRRLQYNPTHYQEASKTQIPDVVFDAENDLLDDALNEQSSAIMKILAELSNHNERNEQRKEAMTQLMQMTKGGAIEVWDEHFKTILLLLLETLGDNDADVRTLSLRTFCNILKHQPKRFVDYMELTIIKILEAHKDPVKEVTRAAEECATTLASVIPAEQCSRILNPIMKTAEFPVNLAAIKMQTKVVEMIPKETLLRNITDIIPGLIKAYDDKQSSVRKASVFCLVALHSVIGEEIRSYLTDLNESKMKLLNLYITRTSVAKANEQNANAQTAVRPS